MKNKSTNVHPLKIETESYACIIKAFKREDKRAVVGGPIFLEGK